jgi:NADPH:quinone reductase-like Zn-dependent oxidoreductase
LRAGGSLSKNPKPGVKQINFGEMIPEASALDKIRDFVDAGKLKSHVQETFPLFRVAEAFGVSNSGTVVGKLAIRPW